MCNVQCDLQVAGQSPRRSHLDPALHGVMRDGAYYQELSGGIWKEYKEYNWSKECVSLVSRYRKG